MAPGRGITLSRAASRAARFSAEIHQKSDACILGGSDFAEELPVRAEEGFHKTYVLVAKGIGIGQLMQGVSEPTCTDLPIEKTFYKPLTMGLPEAPRSAGGASRCPFYPSPKPQFETFYRHRGLCQTAFHPRHPRHLQHRFLKRPSRAAHPGLGRFSCFQHIRRTSCVDRSGRRV